MPGSTIATTVIAGVLAIADAHSQPGRPVVSDDLLSWANSSGEGVCREAGVQWKISHRVAVTRICGCVVDLKLSESRQESVSRGGLSRLEGKEETTHRAAKVDLRRATFSGEGAVPFRSSMCRGEYVGFVWKSAQERASLRIGESAVRHLPGATLAMVIRGSEPSPVVVPHLYPGNVNEEAKRWSEFALACRKAVGDPALQAQTEREACRGQGWPDTALLSIVGTWANAQADDVPEGAIVLTLSADGAVAATIKQPGRVDVRTQGEVSSEGSSFRLTLEGRGPASLRVMSHDRVELTNGRRAWVLVRR